MRGRSNHDEPIPLCVISRESSQIQILFVSVLDFHRSLFTSAERVPLSTQYIIPRPPKARSLGSSRNLLPYEREYHFVHFVISHESSQTQVASAFEELAFIGRGQLLKVRILDLLVFQL